MFAGRRDRKEKEKATKGTDRKRMPWSFYLFFFFCFPLSHPFLLLSQRRPLATEIPLLLPRTSR